jgi:hypothetical protein
MIYYSMLGMHSEMPTRLVNDMTFVRLLKPPAKPIAYPEPKRTCGFQQAACP